MRIHFLHGTETGTAEMLCEDLMAEALPEGATAQMSALEDIQPSEMDGETLYVVVCSTFGSGDLPTGAIEFHDTLTADKPDLSHVRFGLVGLGDRTFGATFNQGSETLGAALVACNAKQIGERCICDASGGDLPEEVAGPWLTELLAQSETA